MADDSGENRQVESLHDAFIEDFMADLAELPRVADAMKEARASESQVGVTLTPAEAENLNARLPWLFYAWIGNLTREVDRLYDHLEGEADARQSEQDRRPLRDDLADLIADEITKDPLALALYEDRVPSDAMPTLVDVLQVLGAVITAQRKALDKLADEVDSLR